MNLRCSQLEQIAHTLPLVRRCDVLRSGALRMATPFLYPNGERISVFLEEKSDLFGSLSLSDYGHTALYLNDAQCQVAFSDRKQLLLDSILDQFSVRYSDGDLLIDIQKPEHALDLRDPIFRLSQACIRIADFATHAQLKKTNPFKDELGKFLAAGKGLRVVPDVRVRGRHQNEVKIDFQTFGARLSSYLCVVAPSDSGAHASSNEVFRKFYDISDENTDIQRVAVYSSRSKLKDADKKRLGDYSEVIAYPAQAAKLTDLIAA